MTHKCVLLTSFTGALSRGMRGVLSPEYPDYVNPNCKYCKIGRESKVVRDSVLLEKIQFELKSNDRVMVVFGHGHILAIEPALKKLMEKQ